MGETMSVTLTKSDVYAAFPLKYMQSFNARPREEIIIPNSACKVSTYWGGGLLLYLVFLAVSVGVK